MSKKQKPLEERIVEKEDLVLILNEQGYPLLGTIKRVTSDTKNKVQYEVKMEWTLKPYELIAGVKVPIFDASNRYTQLPSGTVYFGRDNKWYGFVHQRIPKDMVHVGKTDICKKLLQTEEFTPHIQYIAQMDTKAKK